MRINLIKSFEGFRSYHLVNENVQQAKAFLRTKAKLAKGSDLNQEEVRAAENDKPFLDIKEMLKDNLGLVYMFVKFFHEENIPMEELKDTYTKIKDLKNLMSLLPRKIDQYVDLRKGDEKRTSFEILGDDLRELEIQRIVKKFVDRLPGEFVVTNSDARDRGETVPSIRNAYKTATEKQKNAIRGIALAFEELSDDPSQNKDLQEIFLQGIKRYRTLNEVIQAATQHIKASSNKNVAGLLASINKANELFGFINGAEVIYNLNDRVVFEVRSFQANVIINACTKHCIKDRYSSWDSYLGDEYFHKQYYIWDFNYPPNDNKSIIGITIGPGPSIYACHLKDDVQFVNSFKSHIRSIGIDWELFAPMTPIEIEIKRKRVAANKKIVDDKVTIAEIKKCLEDGADPNIKDGKPLYNAAAKGDIEKVEFLLNSGARVNVGNPMRDAKNVKVLAKLIENGAEISIDIMNNNISDPEAVKLLIDSGLDPNTKQAMPIRSAVKMNAIVSLKLLLDENGSVTERTCLAPRMALSYLHKECFELIWQQFEKTGNKLKPNQLMIDAEGNLSGTWFNWVGIKSSESESTSKLSGAEIEKLQNEILEFLKTIAVPA